MAKLTFRQANLRYLRLFIPVMGFYALACIAGPFLLDAVGRGLLATTVVAVLSALPLLAVLWLMSRYLRETDEFTRTLQLEALAAGAFLTVSFAILWGFLELFGVVSGLWSFLIAPIFFASYGLSYAVRLRRGVSAP